jgi:hypothetical protein
MKDWLKYLLNLVFIRGNCSICDRKGRLFSSQKLCKHCNEATHHMAKEIEIEEDKRILKLMEEEAKRQQETAV